MFQFIYMDKGKKDLWLPRLFELLYQNMQRILPGSLSYHQEKQNWLEEVSPALEKAPRQIILCLHDDALIGYLQYYIRDDLLMVEEIQIMKPYQRTLLFRHLCKYLASVVPEHIRYVEAYADRRNHYSQTLMNKLNMRNVAPPEAFFLHFRGSADHVLRYFR